MATHFLCAYIYSSGNVDDNAKLLRIWLSAFRNITDDEQLRISYPYNRIVRGLMQRDKKKITFYDEQIKKWAQNERETERERE